MNYKDEKWYQDHQLWLAGDGGQRANLSEADLSKANLSEANLSKADLSWANLREANLSKADLRGANLRGVNLRKIVFCGAIIDGAILSPEALGGILGACRPYNLTDEEAKMIEEIRQKEAA